MTHLSVALLQLTPTPNNTQANLAQGLEAVRQAKQMGAQLVVFPEMWNNGYPECDDQSDHIAKWKQHAISSDSTYIPSFQTLAKELNIAILATYLRKEGDNYYNTASLIDRYGTIILTYDKVHTCAFDYPETLLTPGNGFYVAPLDIGKDTVHIGCMICFDREFPESARVLTLKGAEIILTPNACDLDTRYGTLRLHQFEARAYENMVGVAMANYAGDYRQCGGHSIAIGADGREIIKASREEGIYLANFDIDAIRTYQKNEVWGSKHRHPNTYKKLTEE